MNRETFFYRPTTVRDVTAGRTVLEPDRHTLVDVIDKLDNNENIAEKLKKNLKKVSFDSHFHATKSYLHSLILKSLKSYNSYSSLDKIEEMFKDARILFNKGLYDQHHEVLTELEKITIEEEKYEKIGPHAFPIMQSFN